MGKVYFPNFKSKMKYSKELTEFFNKSNIKIDSSYFDLHLLRNLLNKNAKKFFKIKSELELKGFNFEPNNGFFVTSIDKDKYEYLYAEKNSIFSPIELQKLGLWDFLSSLNEFSKQFLNYVPLERLINVAKYSNNLRNILEESGFKILKYKKEVKNNNIKVNTNLNKSRQTPLLINDKEKMQSSIFISKKIVIFLSKMRRVSPKIKKHLKEKGIYNVKHLIFTSRANFLSILSDYSNQNDYTLNHLLDYYNELQDYIVRMKKKYELNKEEMLLFLTDYDFIYSKIETTQIYKDYLLLDKNTLSKYDNDLTNNLGLYNYEIRLLNEINKTNLIRIFDVGINTHIDYYCSNNFDLVEYFYDFSLILIKIDDLIKDKSTLDPLNEEKNLDLLSKLPNYDTYVSNLDLGRTKDLIEIISLRDRGYVLEEIGYKFNLTRERIRQIQSSFIKKNSNYISSICYFLFKKFNYIPDNVIGSYPGISTWLQNNNNIDYDNELGIYTKKKTVNRINGYIVNNITNSSREHLIKDIFEKYNISLSNLLLSEKFDKITLPKKSLREIGSDFLFSRGKKGWSIQEEDTDVIEFFKRFGRVIDGKRNIITYITDNEKAIIYGNGIYIHKEYVDKFHIQAMKTVLLNENLSEYGKSVKEIFEINKNYFKTNGILNYYYLYGLIKVFYDDDNLVFTGRSMRIGTKKEDKEYTNIIYTYLINNNNKSKIETIKRKFHADDSTIQQSSGVYKLDSKTIVSDKFFTIRNHEKQIISQIIEKYISKQDYCHTQNIIDEIYFNTNINDFLKRNLIGKNQERLINYISFYFSDKYSISIRNKTITSIDIKISNYGELIELHYKNKIFTLEELDNLIKYLGIKSNLTRADIINNYVLKISKNKYSMRKYFNIDEMETEELIHIMRKYFSNQIIVFAKEIIWRLKELNILQDLWDKEELLINLISEFDSSWEKIDNNLFTNAFGNLNLMLYKNENKDRDNPIKLNEVLVNFVYDRDRGYLTLDDINEILMGYEIATTTVPDRILLEVFEEHNRGGLIKVEKNEV